ncbi:hypothetical protein [Streptomyces sp. NPDC002676]
MAQGRVWDTVVAERRVLGVVHNITSATRLLDLLALFEGDSRVDVVFSCTQSSALDAGVWEFLESRGMKHVPWSEAVTQDFDLAIATNRGGSLHKLRFPLIGTPHGAGYNKKIKPGAGSREPGAGSREPGLSG